MIRVAIGTQESLSRLPSQKEWKALYDMAKKQSLVGVCFAALQRLGADADEGFARIGISEMQYLTWMGMTAKIQQKNETVNQQCAELQAKLSADGFRSCVLKGQGLGTLYGSLSMLRQSGDIDLWLDADIDEVVPYVMKQYPVKIYDIKHIEYDMFTDTSVELHYQPSIMRTPWYRRRMAAFSKKLACWDNYVDLGLQKITVPKTDYNIVYVLQHIYGHLFENEMSLRQFMDYYMVLRQADKEGIDKAAAYNMMKRIGMDRFASATMWLLQEVFAMPHKLMICEPDEKEGRYLLGLVLNKEKKQKWEYGSVQRFVNEMIRQMKFSMHIMSHYPSEAIWAPIWLVYHFFWKRIHRFNLH